MGRFWEGSRRSVDVAAGTGLVLMWSSGFIGADLGTQHAAADTLLAWRYLAAATLLGAALLATGRIPRRDGLVRHGVVGLLCQGLYLGGVVTGVGLGVPAGTAALIAALQPLLVAVLAETLLGERTTTTQRAGLVLGLGGVALVVTGDLRAASALAWVYLLPLGGMVALSVGTILDRRWHPRGSVLEALTVQTFVVGALVVAEATVAGRLAPPAEPDFWWAVAWVVGLSTFGGYGCYFLVLRRSGPTRVSALLYLTPPTTMLWAAAAFGERPGLLAIVGTAVCAVAVVVVLRRPRGSGTGPARTTIRATCPQIARTPCGYRRPGPTVL